MPPHPLRCLAVAVFAAVGVVAVPPAVHAQFALDQPVPRDSATTTGTLDNGLRYYIRVNHEPQKRAELRLAVQAGSVLEDDDQQGLAHFVEHMAFNGTRDFKAQELVDYMQRIGMRFGADVNASTSFDETVSRLTVPTDEDSTLDKAFRVLENWAHAVTFDDKEIDRERGVVIEEWRSGRGAEQRIRDRQFPVLLKGSRYAERLPIGNKDILETFDHDTLERFYREWYRPDLMAVIAVGDFDATHVDKLIHELFGNIPSAVNPRPRIHYDVPEHDGTLVSIADDSEETESDVSLVSKFARRDPSPVAALRRSLVESLYNGMLNARLDELTRRQDPPYVNAFSSRGSVVRPLEAFNLSATVRDDAITSGMEALLTEAERAARFGFNPAELERARKRLQSRVERQYRERDKTNSAAFAQQCLAHFLANEPYPSMSYYYAAVKNFLPGIELQEVSGMARSWNNDRNRTLLVSGPAKIGITMPSEADLRAAVARIGAAKLDPYQDSATDAPLVAVLPEPGRIASTKEFHDLGLTLWTLSNGARVYVKPTDFKDDEILMRAWSPGGNSLAPDSTWLSASNANWVVAGCGLGPYNLTDLQKYLAGKQAGVNPQINELSEGFSGQARPQDLETLFQMLYAYFTAPRSDPTAFEATRTRFRGILANRAADPSTAFFDSLTAVLFQHHPRTVPLTAEGLDAVKLDAALAFFRARFADADDFTFAFVGRIDLDVIRPLVLRYIGGLKALPRKETWRDTGRAPAVGVVERTFRKGVDDRARTAIVFTGPFTWKESERYTLESLAEVLRTRFRKVIREELGGTYGVQVSGTSARDPKPRYRLQIQFDCDPARVDELTKRVFAVCDSIRTHGIDADELTQVREIQRRGYEVNLRQNGYWAQGIESRDANGLDLHAIVHGATLIQGLSASQIRDAARKYLRPNNYVHVEMLPEVAPATPSGG